MQLDDCDLNDIGGISMAPIQRSGPEANWLDAVNEGVIPQSLYDLYQRAHFLSFGDSPLFLQTATISYSVILASFSGVFKNHLLMRANRGTCLSSRKSLSVTP